MVLPDGPKSFRIGLVVLIQYRLWRTATQPPSHVAVAITLNAKASSLKTKYQPLSTAQYILARNVSEQVNILLLLYCKFIKACRKIYRNGMWFDKVTEKRKLCQFSPCNMSFQYRFQCQFLVHSVRTLQLPVNCFSVSTWLSSVARILTVYTCRQ